MQLDLTKEEVNLILIALAELPLKLSITAHSKVSKQFLEEFPEERPKTP